MVVVQFFKSASGIRNGFNDIILSSHNFDHSHCLLSLAMGIALFSPVLLFFFIPFFSLSSLLLALLFVLFCSKFCVV